MNGLIRAYFGDFALTCTATQVRIGGTAMPAIDIFVQ
jgi:hypothetical protein